MGDQALCSSNIFRSFIHWTLSLCLFKQCGSQSSWERELVRRASPANPKARFKIGVTYAYGTENLSALHLDLKFPEKKLVAEYKSSKCAEKGQTDQLIFAFDNDLPIFRHLHSRRVLSRWMSWELSVQSLKVLCAEIGLPYWLCIQENGSLCDGPRTDW